MRSPTLAFLALLALSTVAAPVWAQEATDDQDPVDLDWVPAWDAPFWPAPVGAALEIVAGRRGAPTSSTSDVATGDASGDYVLALLTLPLDGALRRRGTSEGSAVEGAVPGSDAIDVGRARLGDAAPAGREGGALAVGNTAGSSAEPTFERPAASSAQVSAPEPSRHAAPPATAPADEAASTEVQVIRPRPLAARRTEVPLELLRGAIDRAELAAGFATSLRRLSSIGSRSRWSGLSPELRLRGATGIDQTRSVDSAGIVPGEETLRDASDSLVEVRLTFHLERLLHSGQEVALERARQDVQSERAELRAVVGRELVTYVRAVRRLESDELDDEERNDLELAAERARLTLYLATDGWFRGEETLRRHEGAP